MAGNTDSVQSIIDERLERTAALFEPTVPQVGEAGEGSGDTEDKPRANKPRTWEARSQNRGYTYRTGSDVNDMLWDAIEWYEEKGYRTTLSDVARAWMLAGRDLWLAGQVEVEVERQKTARIARSA